MTAYQGHLPVCYDVRLTHLNKYYLLTYLLGLMQNMKSPMSHTDAVYSLLTLVDRLAV